MGKIKIKDLPNCSSNFQDIEDKEAKKVRGGFFFGAASFSGGQAVATNREEATAYLNQWVKDYSAYYGLQ